MYKGQCARKLGNHLDRERNSEKKNLEDSKVYMAPCNRENRHPDRVDESLTLNRDYVMKRLQFPHLIDVYVISISVRL